jgi:hypothetical protein
MNKPAEKLSDPISGLNETASVIGLKTNGKRAENDDTRIGGFITLKQAVMLRSKTLPRWSVPSAIF